MVGQHKFYIWKSGEYKVNPNTQIKYVGGSPVSIVSATYTGAAPSQMPPPFYYGNENIYVEGTNSANFKYVGVAYHSYEFVSAKRQLLTVIYPPATLMIFKGMKDYYQTAHWAEELVPFGNIEDDMASPFDTGATFNPGDVIYAKADVSADNYAKWTNVAADGVDVITGTGNATPLGRVEDVIQTGGITFLVIHLSRIV